MKYLFILFIFSTLLLSKERDAVMLKITSDFKVSKTTFDVFRSGAEMSLTKSNYVLLDEKAQEEALNSQTTNDGCLDNSCLIDTGKMLAAKVLFVVSIKKAGKFYLFSAKVIDLETSTTKKSFSVLYEHSLKNLTNLFNFSKNLTTSTLGNKENFFFSDEMNYFSPYFKLGVFAYDFGEKYGVKFLYSGLGITFIEYNNNSFIANLNLNTSYNIADSYILVDLNTKFLFNIFKNLNIGLEFGSFFSNGAITPKGGIVTEYRLGISKNLFLTFNIDAGAMYYKIPLKVSPEGKKEYSSVAIYGNLSTSVGWDF